MLHGSGSLIVANDVYEHEGAQAASRAGGGCDLDFGTARPEGGPLRLDPHGSSKVYLAEFAGCDVQVSSG